MSKSTEALWETREHLDVSRQIAEDLRDTINDALVPAIGRDPGGLATAWVAADGTLERVSIAPDWNDAATLGEAVETAYLSALQRRTASLTEDKVEEVLDRRHETAPPAPAYERPVRRLDDHMRQVGVSWADPQIGRGVDNLIHQVVQTASAARQEVTRARQLTWTAAHGPVTVEVNCTGLMIAVAFGPDAKDSGPQALGVHVVEALRDAKARAAAGVDEMTPNYQRLQQMIADTKDPVRLLGLLQEA
ncbi:MAG: YbaB/EbfC family nucleoid-associated protein [Propionibacteriaceae bacterium]|nr:YbaB/EbfC family nucleoid-associated protein [Propionibacteriaceae bacterium]